MYRLSTVLELSTAPVSTAASSSLLTVFPLGQKMTKRDEEAIVEEVAVDKLIELSTAYTWICQ